MAGVLPARAYSASNGGYAATSARSAMCDVSEDNVARPDTGGLRLLAELLS